MQQLPLGRTGLTVSELCLGTMTWGTQNTEAEAHAQIDMALERGRDLLGHGRDVSDQPGAGRDRRADRGDHRDLVCRDSGRRGRVVLATKITGKGQIRAARRADHAGRRCARRWKGRCGGCRPITSTFTSCTGRTGAAITSARCGRYAPTGIDRASRDGAYDRHAGPPRRRWSPRARSAPSALSNESVWGAARWLHLADTLGLPRMASVQNEYTPALPPVRYRLGRAVGLIEDMPLLAFSPLATGLLVGQVCGRRDARRHRGAAARPIWAGGSRRRCFRRWRPIWGSPRGMGLIPARWRSPSAGRGPSARSRSSGRRRWRSLRTNIGAAGLTSVARGAGRDRGGPPGLSGALSERDLRRNGLRRRATLGPSGGPMPSEPMSLLRLPCVPCCWSAVAGAFGLSWPPAGRGQGCGREPGRRRAGEIEVTALPAPGARRGGRRGDAEAGRRTRRPRRQRRRARGARQLRPSLRRPADRARGRPRRCPTESRRPSAGEDARADRLREEARAQYRQGGHSGGASTCVQPTRDGGKRCTQGQRLRGSVPGAVADLFAVHAAVRLPGDPAGRRAAGDPMHRVTLLLPLLAPAAAPRRRRPGFRVGGSQRSIPPRCSSRRGWPGGGAGGGFRARARRPVAPAACRWGPELRVQGRPVPRRAAHAPWRAGARSTGPGRLRLAGADPAGIGARNGGCCGSMPTTARWWWARRRAVRVHPEPEPAAARRPADAPRAKSSR